MWIRPSLPANPITTSRLRSILPATKRLIPIKCQPRSLHLRNATLLSLLVVKPHFNAMCGGTEKFKRQIPHGLGEFVLQICILDFSARPSLAVDGSLPQPVPPALGYTRPFGWRHIACVNPLREKAGNSLVRHISKQGRYAPARERSS